MRTMLVLFLFAFLTACTTPMTLPSSGTWASHTETLGPVVACKGGNFTTDSECNKWPISIASMPAPEIHYAELRAKAATQYSVDSPLIVLKDVLVEYNTEINGVIRGWRASAIAGKVVNATTERINP